jgi:hypothetical protein
VGSEVIVFPFFLVTVGYIVWISVTTMARKQRVKIMVEFHTRLLDKLGTVRDFSDFMQTEAGQRFMKDLTAEPIAAGGAKDRILRAAQVAAVLACLGIGMLALRFLLPAATQAAQQVFATLGVIALSLGVGFAASAATSFRLAGRLGLIDAAADGRAVPLTSRS